MAMSAWYAGKAIVELIDVDRLFSKVPDAEKAEDHKLLRDAASKFHEARRHWTTAASACRTVHELAPADERRLLELDIKTFEAASSGADQLAQEMERGILPPNRPVHSITALLRDQDVIAERRAVAYQGLPGHLPRNY